MNFDLVKTIAQETRYWAESVAEGYSGPTNLTGMCAIASAQLWRQLRAADVPATLHAYVCGRTDGAHIFLVVDDHVVDITATQFRDAQLRNTEVFIAHQREAEEFAYYQASETFETPEQLIAWQKKNRWPSMQIAWSK